MRSLASVFLVVMATIAAAADSVDELIQQARTALMKGETDKALTLLGKAVEADPKNKQARLIRSVVLEGTGKYADAAADLTKIIEQDADAAEAYDRRGSVNFKLGKFKESLADFDKFVQLRPNEANGHWRRGITCYYAGAFDEGRKQFEGYEKVDTNDVENAVWHFLCVARAEGVDKARPKLLKIGKDGRVPMMDVYSLYAGKAKPEDVLTAAQGGKPTPAELNQRMFYAHLYLGLYYEILGDKKKALEHMTPAAEKFKIRHYMGDVAAVHLEVLRKQQK
jgi:lipoprotein NlpI